MRPWVRRSWPVLGVVVVAVVAMGWAGGSELRRAGTDETWARIQREGVLRVGMDPSYPPFEVEAGGEISGYDVDLAREIGRRLGLEVAFVSVGFDGLYDALQTGRCDVLISALPYDRQQGHIASFTGGYFNAGQALVVRSENAGIQSAVDLAGRRVVVEMGSQAHQEALALRDRDRVPLTIATANSSDEAFDELQAGRAEAAIADVITVRLAMRARPDLSIRGPLLTDDSFVIAVRRKSPQLFSAVKGALDNLRGAGWLEQLAERWL